MDKDIKFYFYKGENGKTVYIFTKKLGRDIHTYDNLLEISMSDLFDSLLKVKNIGPKRISDLKYVLDNYFKDETTDAKKDNFSDIFWEIMEHVENFGITKFKRLVVLDKFEKWQQRKN